MIADPTSLAYGNTSDNIADSVRNGLHWWKDITHCPAGHPYDQANTYVKPNGARECRTCHRARLSAWWEQKKTARVADQNGSE